MRFPIQRRVFAVVLTVAAVAMVGATAGTVEAGSSLAQVAKAAPAAAGKIVRSGKTVVTATIGLVRDESALAPVVSPNCIDPAVVGLSCSPGGIPDPLPTQGPPPTASCTVSVGYTVTRALDDNPETGGWYSEFGMDGSVSCNVGTNPAGRGVELIDRTSGTGCDGELVPDLNGCTLGGPRAQITGGGPNVAGATSAATVRLYDDEYYPRAQQAEVIFSVGLLAPLGFRFTQCPSGGARLLSCSPNPANNTAGVVSTTIIVGTNPFTTGVTAPQCVPQRSKTTSWGRDPETVAASRIYDQANNTLAQPEIDVQWCWSKSNNVIQANIIGGPVSRTMVSALSGPITGDYALKKVDLGGKVGYRTTFEIPYEFNMKYTINVLGKEISYERGEKCQVTVDLTFAAPNILADLSQHKGCAPWFAVNQ